jgi:hypothetical protein
MASPATAKGPLFSAAELEATLPKPTANTQIIVTSLAFISLSFSDKAGLVE